VSSNTLPAQLNRQTCRQIINRLRDGLPPPAAVIEYLSVGTEKYLERARQGMKKAANGGFDSTILVGTYGIGKSHLLRRVQVMAEAEGFATRYLEIGGGVYFNNPEAIAERIAGEQIRGQLPQGRGYYTDRKFINQLNYVADYERRNGAKTKGLVLLLDELENSFDWTNLPYLSSRIKAYRYMQTLFCGHSERVDNRYHLSHLYVMIAMTPGVLERAMKDEPGYTATNGGWQANPAAEWEEGGLPDRLEIAPLSHQQALDLLKRIRAIHSRAFDWDASQFLGSKALVDITLSWEYDGSNRDERQLVKTIISRLEIAEQRRS